MRILIFGAGSLGSALGGVLAKRHDVVLIGRKDNVDAVNRQGLRVTGEFESTVEVDAFESVGSLEPPDLMVLTTKAYNTKPVVASLSAVTWPDTMILTLQNGLGNLEVLRAWKNSKVFGGTTSMGAQLLSPGIVKISGMGRTVIGSDLDVPGAKMIADSFSACGLDVVVKDDIVSEIWAKAVVNSCINPLTAILRVSNGRLLESDPIAHLMEDLCNECVAVASSAGLRLSEPSMIDRVRSVARDTAENRSSMLRDIELGRRTEVMQLNGVMCSTGALNGVATPLNSTMSAMVQALEPVGGGKG